MSSLSMVDTFFCFSFCRSGNVSRFQGRIYHEQTHSGEEVVGCRNCCDHSCGLSDMAERNLENMTITLTKEEKKALKQAALDNDMSASKLIRKWIAEYWEKQKETL